MKKACKRLLFPLLGFLALLWFLIRVIPKPSRASYPCMRVAYPFASGFVTYVLSLFIALCSFRKYRTCFYSSRYRLAALFFVIGMFSGAWFLGHSEPSIAESALTCNDIPNEPIGEGVGIHPGRVVWVYDPAATNKACSGNVEKNGVIDDGDDLWFQKKNNDPNVISQMVSRALCTLSAEETPAQAWDAIFRYFNQKKGRGNVGYGDGEIVFIKTNATSAWGEPGRWGMYQEDLHKSESWRPDIAETNPYVVLALVRQLVEYAGVPQENIYVGDPMKQVYENFYTIWQPEFPNIHYLGNDVLPHYASLDIVALGRTPVVKSDSASLFYSDRGEILKVKSERLYTILENADYMINVPTLKAHGRAGITLAAKNHFGSHTRDDAQHLHAGLVSQPLDNDKPVRTGYGLYRVQVDLMAHKYLGRNTMLVLVDGLYACDEAVASPGKWQMSPFNQDWTSSIFLSQDQVAIESVCHDFLRTEYNGDTPATSRPNWFGVDDYLRQAADSTTWPEDVIYDPDRDGDIPQSLGVHEHWNNSQEKQYSRNLGRDRGIELIPVFGVSTFVRSECEARASAGFLLKQNYPNPFNTKTTISYALSSPARILLKVYDLRGNKVCELVRQYQSAGTHSVRWNGLNGEGSPVASGVYIFSLAVLQGDQQVAKQSKRMILLK